MLNKVLFSSCILSRLFFCLFVFRLVLAVCRLKACLLQHNKVGYAVFVFVAVSRNDRVPPCFIPAPSVVSWSHQLRRKKAKGKNHFSYACASWCIYDNPCPSAYICSGICVRAPKHVYNATSTQRVTNESFFESFVFCLTPFVCLFVFKHNYLEINCSETIFFSYEVQRSAAMCVSVGALPCLVFYFEKRDKT